MVMHIPNLSRNQGLAYFNELPIFSKGIQAVYMFFVLSGFLIIRLIFIEKKNNRFSIKNFYIRRMLRIFPLYYVIVIFGFLFYHFILPVLNIPFDNDYNITNSILLTVFFLPNVSASLYMPGGILEVLWSIGIEEQFYLFVAPIFYFVSKNKIFKVIVGITIAYFILYHIPDFEVLRRFSFVYFLLFSGGIIAILEENKRLEFLKTKKLYTLTSCILIIIYFFTNIFEFESSILKNLLTAILFSFFVHAISCNNFKFEIKNKLLNYLGQISYGIYMYHVIALNATVYLFLELKNYQLFNDTTTIILINISTFILTILVAHLSYQYFEKPFLKLKNKFR